MKPGRKLLLLAFSLLLPALLLVGTHGFVMAQMHVAAEDRAIVWAQGDTAAIAAAKRRVENHGIFSGGLVAAASTRNPVPSPCAAEAMELSFGGLSAEDAHAAREELESIAATSGLAVCASHRFRLNDASAEDVAAQWRFAGQQLLVFLGIPAGFCLCVYWMFREQFALPRLGAPGTGLRQGLLLGLGGALLVHAVTLLSASLADMPPSQPSPSGLPLLVTMLVLTAGSPLIEEIAYRLWLITLSERAIGRWPAAVFSTLAFAVSYFPDNAGEALPLLVLGGICSLLYLRTRSLLAPVVTHAGHALLGLLPALIPG